MTSNVRKIKRDLTRQQTQPVPDSITVTLGQLVSAAGNQLHPGALYALRHQPSLPAVINWRIKNVLKEIGSRLEPYNETIKGLFEKFGEAQEDGSFNILPVQTDEFNAEVDKLHAETVTLNIAPIKIALLEKAQGLTAEVLLELDWLIVE